MLVLWQKYMGYDFTQKAIKARFSIVKTLENHSLLQEN